MEASGDEYASWREDGMRRFCNSERWGIIERDGAQLMRKPEALTACGEWQRIAGR